ncbi:MAG: hypothetical protein ACKOJH_12065, partial [Actinomycetota bacterium]
MIRRIPARVVSLLVVALSIVALPSSPVRAVDYRLEIVTGSFTTRIGERVIITIATPNNDDITALLTDPAATARRHDSPARRRKGAIARLAGPHLSQAADGADCGSPTTRRLR